MVLRHLEEEMAFMKCFLYQELQRSFLVEVASQTFKFIILRG